METIYKILKKNPFILFPFIREYNIILQNMINLIFKIELITLNTLSMASEKL